jgi:hypothetical protein
MLNKNDFTTPFQMYFDIESGNCYDINNDFLLGKVGKFDNDEYMKFDDYTYIIKDKIIIPDLY